MTILSPQPGSTGSLADPLQYAIASRDADVPHLVETALARKQARLAMQPVVRSGDTDSVAFYEGLVRLLDEGGRVIPAAQFMPVIEETDLGRQIDAVSLELALRMLRFNTALRLSINVSARSFGDARWRNVLDDGLRQGGNLGDRLILEISEGSAMMLHELVIRFMAEMQPRGVCFALDGFGGGLTAFRYLKDFFFDLVKTHKTFAQNVAEDPDNQVLIESLVTVAHQFEMFAVIDGVETAADAAYLRQIGADCLQGFFFGPPRFAPV